MANYVGMSNRCRYRKKKASRLYTQCSMGLHIGACLNNYLSGTQIDGQINAGKYNPELPFLETLLFFAEPSQLATTQPKTQKLGVIW